jgi:hypothetical protein
MRRRNLPQLVDVGARGLEVVSLKCLFGLCDEIRDLPRVLWRLSNGRRWPRSFALRTKHFEAEEHHGKYDGETATDHHREAFGIEFFRIRLVVGPSRSGHCRGFRERIRIGSTRSPARRILRWL